MQNVIEHNQALVNVVLAKGHQSRSSAWLLQAVTYTLCTAVVPLDQVDRPALHRFKLVDENFSKE